MGQGIHVLLRSTVKFLLEDRIRFHGLEFGLEITDLGGMIAAVGPTTCIGEIVSSVLGLIAGSSPTKERFS